MNHFSKYLQASEISGLPDISSSTVQGFMKWLAAQKNLPTLKSAATSMRVLLRYLYRNGHIQEDYSAEVFTVRCRKTVPSVYSSDEIEKMLGIFNQSSAVGIRNYAMVLMAVRLGMRASDICAITFQNIHWEKNIIEFVTLKTGAPAVLPLSADVGNAIIRYLKDVRPNLEDNHIFLRMQTPFRKLNPVSLHLIVSNAFRDAGITAKPGRRYGPHALRASLATSMMKKEVFLFCQALNLSFMGL